MWPQSTFYSIASDALSPLCFGVCFVGLIKFYKVDRPSAWIGLWIGLSLAATCLSKTGNVPLLIVVSVAVVFRIWNFRSQKGNALFVFGVFLISAAVPLVAWLIWNYQNFGDLTATASKIQLLGWTRKSPGGWWPHPIFTCHGALEFWSQVTASFWRGEFIWHGQRLAWAPADLFYWSSSTLVLAVTIFALSFRRRIHPSLERQELWLAIFCFGALVSFLVFLSIRFDFGASVYPSREHPYFISGRLLNAAAIPFFIIYAFAIDQLTAWIKGDWIRWAVVCAIAILVIAMQLSVNAPAFSSRYNFFHLPTFKA